MLDMEKRRYRLSGLTPILGSQSANPAVRTQYIISKAPDEERKREEEALGPRWDEDVGHTVFLRDDQDRLIIMEHALKGYFKGALSALKQQSGVASEKSKVDKYVFIAPRRILLTREGKPLREEDDVFERPLRAQTMQGERVTLVSSELVEDPWELAFELTLIPNRASAKSASLTWDVLETALEYGALCGIGQFRNGGYGRFTWERMEEKNR